jgi:hypothetical protein
MFFSNMSKRFLVKVGVAFTGVVLSLGSLSPVFSIEPTATRPGEVRKELRQEIKEDRMALKEDTKALRKMVGTRGVFSKVTLTAKTSDTAPTTLTVTREGKTYTINVTTNTQIRRRFGGKGTLSDLQINDSLDIAGKWVDEAQTTVEAKVVRDESVQKRLAVFVGKVKSITGSTIVIESVARGNQTVTVAATTKIVSRKETTLALTDIKEGHIIRVKGVWNNQLNTVNDVSNIKDYSLPVIVRPVTATSAAESR